MAANADSGADCKEGGGTTLPNTTTMNALNLRAASRTKLSLRYGATHAQTMTAGRTGSTPVPTAELRRLVAAMVD